MSKICPIYGMGQTWTRVEGIAQKSLKIRGLTRHPWTILDDRSVSFTAVTWVRIPLGTPIITIYYEDKTRSTNYAYGKYAAKPLPDTGGRRAADER
jgi:hypothetical protein